MGKIERLAGPRTHVCWTPDATPPEDREVVSLVREDDLVELEKRTYWPTSGFTVFNKHGGWWQRDTSSCDGAKTLTEAVAYIEKNWNWSSTEAVAVLDNARGQMQFFKPDITVKLMQKEWPA